ncbi:f3196ab9-226a-45c3-afd4-75f8fedede1a [Thermothielavioides terrestris]|uniref:F3196ab9-226a-45c3-afd4-75f8fedede1a n=1 Tax=Thermothielavioides terrestris TaxID=2587410 RepID=A0A3S4AUG0_9PEZI|nr:f3196ab9-226a-45c3-afd4-75f8fedede1a [Thermothielavioides terrestris]
MKTLKGAEQTAKDPAYMKRVGRPSSTAASNTVTVLRPDPFMANFVEPMIQCGYTETKKGTWTSSMRAESLLGLVDHVDIARFVAAAFQYPGHTTAGIWVSKARISWFNTR